MTPSSLSVWFSPSSEGLTWDALYDPTWTVPGNEDFQEEKYRGSYDRRNRARRREESHLRLYPDVGSSQNYPFCLCPNTTGVSDSRHKPKGVTSEVGRSTVCSSALLIPRTLRPRVGIRVV